MAPVKYASSVDYIEFDQNWVKRIEQAVSFKRNVEGFCE